MLLKAIKQIWSTTGSACAAALAPAAFLLTHFDDKFPISLLFSYMNAINGVPFLFAPNTPDKDEKRIPIAPFLFDVGFWAIAGIPYSLGKLFDFGLGYGFKEESPFSNALTMVAGIPGTALGVCLAGTAALLMYVVPTIVLGSIDLSMRIMTAAAGVVAGVIGLAVDAVFVGVACTLTVLTGWFGLMLNVPWNEQTSGKAERDPCNTPVEKQPLITNSNNLISENMPNVRKDMNSPLNTIVEDEEEVVVPAYGVGDTVTVKPTSMIDAPSLSARI